MERKKPVNLRLSDATLAEMAEHEGFVPYAYDDKDPKPTARKTFITPELAETVQGTLTIGFGHTRTVKPGDRVTREAALSLFRSDAREAESCVHRYVTVPLTQGEFDGMVDLFFNIGPGRLRGTNGPDDPGRDGIAVLGRTGNGRPSTLLAKLNEGNYEQAAECFTQWRSKGTVWEWGLLQRRLRFMLVFMGLPIVRAMTRLPNVMPATDQARYELVQTCIKLAREEAEDASAMVAPAKPEPEPELVLDKPLPPAPPAPEAKPAPPPPPAPPPVVVAKPPPEPVIIAPKSVDVRSIPYGEIDPDRGAKNMSDSQRGVGMVIVGIGSIIQIVTMRLGVGTAIGAIAFDLSRDPVVIALAATGVAVVIGWATRKRGTKVMAEGMKNATQVLK